MPRITSITKSILENPDFVTYPVWVWDDTTTLHQPLSDPINDIKDYFPVFIHAEFESSNGVRMYGYTVGTVEHFYAFFLFINNHAFGFNINMAISEVCKLNKGILNIPIAKLFPLSYKLLIPGLKNSKSSGVIILGNKSSDGFFQQLNRSEIP